MLWCLPSADAHWRLVTCCVLFRLYHQVVWNHGAEGADCRHGCQEEGPRQEEKGEAQEDIGQDAMADNALDNEEGDEPPQLVPFEPEQ